MLSPWISCSSRDTWARKKGLNPPQVCSKVQPPARYLPGSPPPRSLPLFYFPLGSASACRCLGLARADAARTCVAWSSFSRLWRCLDSWMRSFAICSSFFACERGDPGRDLGVRSRAVGTCGRQRCSGCACAETICCLASSHACITCTRASSRVLSTAVSARSSACRAADALLRALSSCCCATLRTSRVIPSSSCRPPAVTVRVRGCAECGRRGDCTGRPRGGEGVCNPAMALRSRISACRGDSFHCLTDGDLTRRIRSEPL